MNRKDKKYRKNQILMNRFVSLHNINLRDAIYLMVSVYSEHPGVIYGNILHRAREYNRASIRGGYVWLTKGEDEFNYRRGRL